MGMGTRRVWVWVKFHTHGYRYRWNFVPINYTGMGMVLLYPPHTLPIAIRRLSPRGPGGAVPVGARGIGRRKAAGCGAVGWMDRGETVVGPGWIWEDPKVGSKWVDGWRRGRD